jgi:hypothetical protein
VAVVVVKVRTLLPLVAAVQVAVEAVVILLEVIQVRLELLVKVMRAVMELILRGIQVAVVVVLVQ